MLRKTKLDTVEVLISKAFIDSCISHDEFVSVNNVLRKYNKMKEEIKKPWNFCGIYYIKTMGTYCVSCKKSTSKESSSVRKTKENRLMLLKSCAFWGKKKLT